MENKWVLSVCMPSGFPEDVKSPPQSVVDVERSQYKAARHEAMKIELDGHKMTRTYEAASPSQTCRCEVNVSLQDGQGWPDSKNKGQTCG